MHRGILLDCLRATACDGPAEIEHVDVRARRHDEHPLIHFVDGAPGRRAALLGTQLDVWEVIATVRDNEGVVADAADYLGISRGLVEAAVTYYGEFQDEINAEIALNDEESERAHAAWLAGQDAVST